MEEESFDVTFDHAAETTAMSDPNADPPRYLEQNGNKFTFAEYNRFEKKWLPEPKHLEHFTIRTATKGITDLLLLINEHLGKIVKVLPALEMYGREAVAKRAEKDRSFNELKGKLGVMQRELAKYKGAKKLVDKKKELAEIEKELEGDGE